VFADGRCPSVRPSVTFGYCIQTAEDIVKLLSQPGSPIILVSWRHPVLPNSNWSPLRGGSNTRGWEKFSIFDLKHRLSRKRYWVRPWWLWNVSRKSVPMTSSDLESRNARDEFFRWISFITLAPFDLERPSSAEWCGGVAYFQRSAPPPQHRAGPQQFPIWGSFYLGVHPLTQNHKIWRGSTYGEEGLVFEVIRASVLRGQSPRAPKFWGSALRLHPLTFTTFGVAAHRGRCAF